MKTLFIRPWLFLVCFGLQNLGCQMLSDEKSQFMEKGEAAIEDQRWKGEGEDLIVPPHAVETDVIKVTTAEEVKKCISKGPFGSVFIGKSLRKRDIAPEELEKEALEQAMVHGASHIVWLPKNSAFIAQGYDCDSKRSAQ